MLKTRLIPCLSAAILFVALSGCSNKDGNPVSDMIASITPAKPGEVARDAFNVYDADTRRNSVALLTTAKFGGEPPYVRLYRLLIDDPDATVRAAAIKALGVHGTADDARLITPRLTDEASMVRWEAAQALQKLHHPEAVDPLLKALREDEDADTRTAAAYALGQYPAPPVFQGLVAALDDPEFAVVESARRSLHTLTGYDMGTDGTLWLIWAQRHQDDLFDKRQAYTWQPFVKPPSVVEKMKFWKKREIPAPRRADGIDATG